MPRTAVCPRHGPGRGDVRRALAETAVQNFRAGIGERDAHVSDDQLVAEVLRQTRRAGQTARQVDGLRRVTDCGADETPSQTTPLSAAST